MAKQVDREKMRVAAGQIDDAHGKIHQIQTQLSTEMGTLRAKWIGPASNAFQSGYQAFDAEYEKVKAGLEKIHTQLVDTQMSYQQGEDGNIDMAKNEFAKLLGGQ